VNYILLYLREYIFVNLLLWQMTTSSHFLGWKREYHTHKEHKEMFLHASSELFIHTHFTQLFAFNDMPLIFSLLLDLSIIFGLVSYQLIESNT